MSHPVYLHTSSCSHCNCVPVKYAHSVKYLGLIFDSDLSWNSHLSFVCQRLRAVSCVLYNIRYFMPFSVRKCVTHALAYSVLRYGITVYGHCTVRWQRRVNSLLRLLLKNIAYDLPIGNNIDIFRRLKFPNFNALLTETIALKHFWCSQFTIPYVPARDLRPKYRYCIPRSSTRYGKRTRQYYVPACFNIMPPSVFRMRTKYTLKKFCGTSLRCFLPRNYLIECYYLNSILLSSLLML